MFVCCRSMIVLVCLGLFISCGSVVDGESEASAQDSTSANTQAVFDQSHSSSGFESIWIDDVDVELGEDIAILISHDDRDHLQEDLSGSHGRIRYVPGTVPDYDGLAGFNSEQITVSRTDVVREYIVQLPAVQKTSSATYTGRLWFDHEGVFYVSNAFVLTLHSKDDQGLSIASIDSRVF